MAHHNFDVSLKELQQAEAFINELAKLSTVYPRFRATVKSTTEKDPQQRKLYSAEGMHSEWRRHRFVCFAELRDFVIKIQESLWYQERVGNQEIAISGGEEDQLSARGGLFFISIPPIHRRKMVVLHEVAHAIYWTPSNRAQDHGPNFCKIYLELVAKFMGERSAEELARLFKRKGIRVSRTGSMKLTQFRSTKTAPYKVAFGSV